MTIELKTHTVSDLYEQFKVLVERGEGGIPVCATDCRGRYPFTAYTVLNQSGYTDALLIYVRPDAHFAQLDPLPMNVGANRINEMNAEADRVKTTCGAFAGKHHPQAPSAQNMKAALEDILENGESLTLEQIMAIAKEALCRE